MSFGRVRQLKSYLSGEGLGPFLLKAMAGSGAVRLGAMAASFVVGVQLARMLGVDGYGYYGLALSIITIASIPGELGVSQLVTREVAAAESRGDNAHIFGVLRWANRTVLALSVLTGFLAVLGAFAGSRSQRYAHIALAVLCGAPVIPLMAMARVSGGALQGLHHVVRGQIPANLLRPALLMVFLLSANLLGLSVGASGAMLLNSVTAALAFAAAYVWLRQRLPARPRAPVAPPTGQWIASTVPLALTDGMRVLQTELTILMVGLLTAASQVALFRVAMVTAGIAAMAAPMVAQIALPTIARLYAGDEQVRLQKVVTACAWAQFVGVTILSLPLVFAAEPLLRLVYGSAYAPAATALRIVVLGQIANALFGPNAALLNMTHHERRVTRAMAYALALNIIATLLLARWWGAVGAAWAFVLGLICWNVMAWRDGLKFVGINSAIGLPTR